MTHKQAWTKKPPTKEGWYSYRDDHRTVVLHVFDPSGDHCMQAWDWKQGQLQLCPIATYPGEWYGPLAQVLGVDLHVSPSKSL